MTWMGISSIPTTFHCAETKRIGARRGTNGSVVLDGTNVGEIGQAFVPLTMMKKVKEMVTLCPLVRSTRTYEMKSALDWGGLKSRQREGREVA